MEKGDHGVYLTGHPMDGYRDIVKRCCRGRGDERFFIWTTGQRATRITSL